MARKYLFSPIGNTDPIKYLYDGSMIHICRYYQPVLYIFYLSKGKMENHKKDQPLCKNPGACLESFCITNLRFTLLRTQI